MSFWRHLFTDLSKCKRFGYVSTFVTRLSYVLEIWLLPKLVYLDLKSFFFWNMYNLQSFELTFLLLFYSKSFSQSFILHNVFGFRLSIINNSWKAISSLNNPFQLHIKVYNVVMILHLLIIGVKCILFHSKSSNSSTDRSGISIF